MQPTAYAALFKGVRHARALALYLALVALHFAEHIAQLAQVYFFGWSPRAAGGLLGEWFPGLASSEWLHTGYNSLQLTGLILLLPGFRGRARFWWATALAFQSWHFLEHTLLQAQYLTGTYLFGATVQTSVLESLFPRLELHFVYNLLVLIPLIVAALLYALDKRRSSPSAL